jgi:1-acyl-sn-glycerol-3-phosphate acyltransferase
MGDHMADWLAGSLRILRHDLSHVGSRFDRALLRLAVLLLGPLVEVRGRERLAALPEPALLVLNHNNTFECLAVPPVLLFERGGRPIHFLIDWMYLRLPLIGAVLSRSGSIPVYGKRARWGLWERHRQGHRGQSPLALALARLAAGGTVGIFPEGRRNGRAESLLRSRRGLGPLILLSQAPVVPIGIEFPAGRRLGRMPRAGRIRVAVGEALDFRRERQAFGRRLVGGGPPAGLLRLARQAAEPLVHRVMRELAALCAKDYPFAQPNQEARRPPLPAALEPAPGRS